MPKPLFTRMILLFCTAVISFVFFQISPGQIYVAVAPPGEASYKSSFLPQQSSAPSVSDETKSGASPSSHETITESSSSYISSASASSALSAVQNLTKGQVTQSAVSLSWSALAQQGITYLVYRDSALYLSLSGTSCNVTGLSPATQYLFTVRAKDQRGNLSPAASLRVSTPAPLQTATPASYVKILSGYFASWAAYSGFSPLNVAGDKLNLINYAFAAVGSDLKIALGDASVDPGNLQKLAALKKSYPSLKALVSVGGWEGSARFSDAALTEESRRAFADSVAAFLKQYGLDGVDIDWEYPTGGGKAGNITRPQDPQNFTLLLMMLRERLDTQGAADGKRYLLTIAGGASGSYTSGVQLSAIRNYVDYANLMTYDLHGPWDTHADLNAPLYTPAENSPQYKVSVDGAVNTWISKGFPASKILLGVPFYGYLYKSAGSANNGLYQPYSSAASISYDKIVASYLNLSGVLRFFHPQGIVPWLYANSSFISYDDETSLRAKAQYANAKGLAGIFVWELSQNKSGSLLGVLRQTLK